MSPLAPLSIPGKSMHGWIEVSMVRVQAWTTYSSIGTEAKEVCGTREPCGC